MFLSVSVRPGKQGRAQAHELVSAQSGNRGLNLEFCLFFWVLLCLKIAGHRHIDMLVTLLRYKFRRRTSPRRCSRGQWCGYNLRSSTPNLSLPKVLSKSLEKPLVLHRRQKLFENWIKIVWSEPLWWNMKVNFISSFFNQINDILKICPSWFYHSCIYHFLLEIFRLSHRSPIHKTFVAWSSFSIIVPYPLFWPAKNNWDLGLVRECPISTIHSRAIYSCFLYLYFQMTPMT